jgi:four helix bundle protein
LVEWGSGEVVELGMNMNLKNDFRELKVWQKCRDIRVTIWKLCKKFTAEEKYRLADQMIRASRSSTANIAEGYGRYHFQENIQFCRQSRGSLYELMDHILTAEECEYIDQEECEYLINEVVSAIRLLSGYIKYLKTQKERK